MHSSNLNPMMFFQMEADSMKANQPCPASPPTCKSIVNRIFDETMEVECQRSFHTSALGGFANIVFEGMLINMVTARHN